MKLNDFILRWNGKYIDTDNAYGAQCMDEMHSYCVEVLGIGDLSVLAAPSARDVYTNFSNIKGHELFDKIDNSPTGVPQEGDIVFWTNAPYGHVAIFVEGDDNSFRSFDQNYPTGSPCHIQNHVNYNNVGGWFRYKGGQDLQAQLDQLRLERDRNWEWFVAVCNALKTGANVDTAVAEATKLLTIEQAVLDKDRQLAEVQKQTQDLQGQLDLKDKAIEDVHQQAVTLTVEIGKLQQQVDALTKQTAEEQQQIKDLSDAAKITQRITGLRKWVFDKFFRS